MAGTIRIVAQIHAKDDRAPLKVRFLVDGKLLGVDEDGPPYATEWVDDNPLESREIVVEATDGDGRTAKDSVTLNAYEFSDTSSVSSMLLEVTVLDKKGRFVGGLKPDDFTLRENGEIQKLDLVTPEEVPATFALLVDSSQSMAPRADFVRLAARRITPHLSPKDRVIVAPFTVGLGAVTGPTGDHKTMLEAINAIRPSGGTAILESLSQTAERLKGIDGRRVIVLITDGFDENSKQTVEGTIKDLLSNQITVYIVGVGGVSGVSLRGQALLRKVALETGGKAFFPWDDRELAGTYDLVAANVTNRYLVAYTPKEAVPDGSWHAIDVTTPSPEHVVHTRKGFFAPKPPPIKPTIEFTFPETAAYAEVSANDLFVLEDGVEQAIDTFHEAVAPVSIVLALDASGSMRRSAQLATGAARGFVKTLRPADQLAVLMFADKAVFTHDFSKDREQSFAAIAEYVADGGTALYDAMGTALARVRNVPGRRAIVVVTDGRDEDNPGTGPGSVRAFDDVLDMLKDSGAVVFGVGIGSRVDRRPLEELAKLSGGSAYFPADAEALSAEYQRIVDNLRRRWVVGYESKNVTRDGKWRKVEIRVRSTNLLLASLGGYFAPER
ncbi:MAG: VWA domain-containing protein [Vicinamibacterales bacterium]